MYLLISKSRTHPLGSAMELHSIAHHGQNGPAAGPAIVRLYQNGCLRRKAQERISAGLAPSGYCIRHRVVRVDDDKTGILKFPHSMVGLQLHSIGFSVISITSQLGNS